MEESFDQHSNVSPSSKAPRRVSPSQLRRKERRAADPAVRQRAAQHEPANAAGAAAAATEIEAALHSPEKVRNSCAPNQLMTSPVKDDVREEVVQEAVEKLPLVEVPHDFANRANSDYEHDFEKTKEAEKLLSETDRCCFCGYECPPPTQQENNDRFSNGVLESLWDHIELSHPVAYEWLS